MNSQQVTLMVLKDLSAAFDTVNHHILLDRLDKVIGMRGVMLEWFRSYLLIVANKSVLMGLCLINGILTVVYHRDPV